MEHIREGKHGARSTKQAIAIGLSKARRAGVKLPAPKTGPHQRLIAVCATTNNAPAPERAIALAPEARMTGQ
jgi:hypothetical protein